MSMSVVPPFERTVCGCSKCVACCKKWPGALIPRDIPRIAEYLKRRGTPMPRITYLSSAEAGRISMQDRKLDVDVRQVIIVKPLKGGRCSFLNDDDSCSIHAVSPFGCAYFDVHMDPDEADRRVEWANAQRADPAYMRLRGQLLTAPTPHLDKVRDMLPVLQTLATLGMLREVPS